MSVLNAPLLLTQDLRSAAMDGGFLIPTVSREAKRTSSQDFSQRGDQDDR